MSRGRLIWPFQAVIEQYNTGATEASEGGTGYHPFFREPVKTTSGEDTRKYDSPIVIPCQVETERDEVRVLRMTQSGDNEQVAIVLVFHFQDLEDFDLVDDNGRSRIKKGDRLLRVEDLDEIVLDDYGSLNMVITGAEPHSYGLSSRRRNLLVCRVERREHGA